MQGNRGVWSETVFHVLCLTDIYCYCLFVLVFIERGSSVYEFEQNKFSRHVCNNGAANFENKYLFWGSIFVDKHFEITSILKVPRNFQRIPTPPPPPPLQKSNTKQPGITCNITKVNDLLVAVAMCSTY